MNRNVIHTRDFAQDASAFIVEKFHAALEQRDKFRLALSGGQTPRAVYTQLAREQLPWENSTLTFSDERCVPPDNKESNFRMAHETLLQPAAVPASSILRLRGEIAPRLAADEYAEALQSHGIAGEEKYEHDLILLGLGEDGHTASLFPGTAALNEKRRLVAANFVPKLDAWRLTFTLPLIFAARAVCFLVAANKQPELIARVLQGDQDLPAARVDAGAKNVTWIIKEG